ncbi:hypothetical protein D0T84_22470 [Dysgonomonas sp. 521]|nr:hypothetical protein [Dysgonomonas sp. 521]
MPYSCIAEFNRSKNITKTEVLGGVGTVKELYGLGDWDITIRGIAIDSRDGTGTTAREQIETLCKWAEVCDTIGIMLSHGPLPQVATKPTKIDLHSLQ